MLVNLYDVDEQEWVKNPNNLYIGRKTERLEGSKWANPHPIRGRNNRKIVVNRFEQYIRNNRELLKDIHQLKGKTLGCWCHPQLCHGNVLLKILNETMEPNNITVSSTATFTSTATITSTTNSLTALASGQYSPRPFSSSTRTRSSTGTLLKSTYMRVRVSPDKIPTAAGIDPTNPSSLPANYVPGTFPGQSPVLSTPADNPSSTIIERKSIDPTENNMADLVRRINDLEDIIQQQAHFNHIQYNKITDLEKKVNSLEGQLIIVNSQFTVRDHVIEGLKGEIQRLQQYTRRYTVSVTGIEKKQNERPDELREEVLKLVEDVTSNTTEHDIDKFHRNGRTFNNGKDQEILIRFKSHAAKEAFYRGRKSLPPTRRGVKIRPSLSMNQKNLLKDAEKIVEDYNLGEELQNPVEFVLANVHGETQVKLKNKFRGSEFVTFRSVNELMWTLNQVQSIKQTDEKYDEFASWADQ